DISFVEIKLQGTGEGNLRYKKRDDNDEMTIDFKLLPATMRRLAEQFDEIHFLDGGGESYQADKQLPHLGTITLGMRAEGREKNTSFNYSNNRTVMKLVDLFRAIENQQRRQVELRLARQFSPLDLPRQLKIIEDEMKRGRIAEPEQMLPLLSEISMDDSLPLI